MPWTSSMRIVFHGDAKWSLDEAHQIGSRAEVLRTRLREELREDRGGVYGVAERGEVLELRPQWLGRGGMSQHRTWHCPHTEQDERREQ